MAANEPLGGTQRLRNAANAGSRRSGARALFFTLVALGAAAGAAVLINKYVDSQRYIAPTIRVVVAATDMSMGTKITPEQLKTIAWPQTALPEGYLSKIEDLSGRVALGRIMAGEPVLESKLASKDARGGLAALIPPSMRAVAVRVDDVVGVAGFIHPEDRVDVIVTMTPQKPENAEPTSKVILQNVKVLTVGKELDIKEGARGRATSVTVATLLVDPEQAEKLALAAAQGEILLTLRNWGDDDAISTHGMVPSVMLTDARPLVPSDAIRVARARRALAEKTEAPMVVEVAPVSPPAEEVVEILRGDLLERKKFESKQKRPPEGGAAN
jgi:pilus assembly protein CpaB